jgi:peptide/nickel transport system substrate-binding protein
MEGSTVSEGSMKAWRQATARRWSRRRTIGLAGAAGSAALLAACGGGSGSGGTSGGTGAAGVQVGAQRGVSTEQPRPGGVISQSTPTDPPSMDLHQVTTYTGVWPTAPCFNQLIQFDDTKPIAGPSDIKPDLAEKWEQPDPTTTVFTLRRGVKFHDGSDFTAEDAKVQIDWIRNPPQGKVSPRRAALSTIKDVELVDPYTLRITTTQPTPSLLMNLASHYFAIGQKNDILTNSEVSARLIGTGPFKLKQYQRSNLLELEKNPTYFVQGRPYLDGLRFFIIPDWTTAVTNFIAGQYQMVYGAGFKPGDAERAKQEMGDKVEVVQVSSTLRDFVFLNAKRKPYDDIRVRQAISLALDRDAAIKVVREGAGVRGGYMNPKGQWAISEADLKKYEGYDKPNLQKARELLQAAGVTTPLQASTTTRTDFKDMGEFVKDQLSRAGININLTLADTATAQPVLQRGDFDIGPWTIAINVDDPDATFSEISTSKAVRNWSQVFDPQIDALYERQSQMMNVEERKKVVQELEKAALNAYQGATLYFQEAVFGKATSVQNMVFQDSLYTNRRMENVWLKQ